MGPPIPPPPPADVAPNQSQQPTVRRPRHRVTVAGDAGSELLVRPDLEALLGGSLIRRDGRLEGNRAVAVAEHSPEGSRHLAADRSVDREDGDRPVSRVVRGNAQGHEVGVVDPGHVDGDERGDRVAGEVEDVYAADPDRSAPRQNGQELAVRRPVETLDAAGGVDDGDSRRQRRAWRGLDRGRGWSRRGGDRRARGAGRRRRARRLRGGRAGSGRL